MSSRNASTTADWQSPTWLASLDLHFYLARKLEVIRISTFFRLQPTLWSTGCWQCRQATIRPASSPRFFRCLINSYLCSYR